MATEPQILSSFSPRACPRCMLTCFSAGDPPSAPLHLSRTLYKSALFIENKPNLLDAQMNLKFCSKMAYENKRNWTLGQNKPNSNPIQTQSNPICRMPK